MTTEIRNARIKSTFLGTEDHGIFTCYLHVEGDGWGCGFGGFALDQWDRAKERRVGHPVGIEFINAILGTLEVGAWEKLPGTFLRVETEGLGGSILRVGHPIKEKWFDPEELFARQEDIL